MTSQILQFEDKTLLFIQITKYPLEITIWSREQLKRTMMRKKIISGGRDLSAVFFFLEMKFCFQTFQKYFFFQEDGVQSSMAKLESLKACFGDIL